MHKTAAIAYIQISRNNNPDQAEFPPPLGHTSGSTLTVTAAKADAIKHQTFKTNWLGKPKAVRLVNSHIKPCLSWFVRHNHFIEALNESDNQIVAFDEFLRAEKLLAAY